MRARHGRAAARVAAPEFAEHVTLATLAKALGHPARIEIVALLHERQSCIGCDIVDRVGLAQSTTSEHLRILKAAGIITGEIERPRVCYSLNPAALEPLRAFLNTLAAPDKTGDERSASGTGARDRGPGLGGRMPAPGVRGARLIGSDRWCGIEKGC